jgi:hypothetical protein
LSAPDNTHVIDKLYGNYIYNHDSQGINLT